MEYIYSSRNNEMVLLSSNDESNRENLDSSHQQDIPFFGQFGSPSLDEILHNNHPHMSTSPRTMPPPSPSKPKRLRKQRSAGKKDRHSKIHTAQGLRDRRMRLSLHIARKFFGLQDMLGFDKASKTIEWLFCKSKKAIDEVTESVNLQQNTTPTVSKGNNESCESPVSDCKVDSEVELDVASTKGKQLKGHEEINDNTNSINYSTKSDLLAKELRSKARARARARTRERMMINDPEKSKQMFGENANDDFDQLQLGFSGNHPSNHYIQESSSSPNEYSGTNHFFEYTHLNNNNTGQKTDEYLGTGIASSSTYYSGYNSKQSVVNPPAGWLNSSNTFLSFFGGWDSENFTENNGVWPNLAPFKGDIQGQTFSSNLVHFQTQDRRE